MLIDAPALLTEEAFIARAVGVPWRRWCASWARMDCYGKVILWHRHVLGVELGDVPRTDLASGFSAARGWEQCDPEPGCTSFMLWRDGAPTHCGTLVRGGMLLHAQEGYPIPEHGSVRLTRLVVMQRLATDIRFYRYTGC